MSPWASAALALIGLLVGAFSIAVLQAGFTDGWRAAILRPVEDGLSALHQQDLEPARADRLLFRLAPLLALSTVSLAVLVIPLAPHLIAFDPSIGLFYFIVILGPFVIAMMNAGWSQNSKEGLFGTFRAAAHLIAYEVPLGFAMIGPVMAAGSLSTERIVQAQNPVWYVVWQPLGSIIYLLAALFMTYRHPFDIPQAGSELEGGVLGEFSGVSWLVFKLALDGIFFLLIAMGVVLFFGGWSGPLLPAPVWFVFKTWTLGALVLWAGRFLPRLRQDQMLNLAWKILLPASFVNIAIVGILALVLPAGAL